MATSIKASIGLILPVYVLIKIIYILIPLLLNYWMRTIGKLLIGLLFLSIDNSVVADEPVRQQAELVQAVPEETATKDFYDVRLYLDYMF